jgi:type III pantothenate kinase
MELILDFGNTRKKIALFKEGQLVALQQHADIDTGIILSFIEQNTGITAAILSSVIIHDPSIDALLRSLFFTVILDETTPLPIRNCYRTPVTLGKDRLAAAVAGAAFFPGSPVLVINAGSAITYDVVNAAGAYCGGALSPGMKMRFRALHTFTGKLPLVEYKETIPVVGTDTEQSILSGVVHGIAGEMEEYIHLAKEQYPEMKVILSGGDMNYFVKRLKSNIFAIPNIVLSGLHQILMFNVSKTD